MKHPTKRPPLEADVLKTWKIIDFSTTDTYVPQVSNEKYFVLSCVTVSKLKKRKLPLSNHANTRTVQRGRCGGGCVGFAINRAKRGGVQAEGTVEGGEHIPNTCQFVWRFNCRRGTRRQRSRWRTAVSPVLIKQITWSYRRRVWFENG